MPIKTIASILVSLFLTACFGWKPFQPHPPTFTQWVISADGVKAAMRQCGYIDLFGYGGDRNSTLNDHAERENCMFKKGFKYKDGYQGLCSSSDRKDIPACQPNAKPEKEIP